MLWQNVTDENEAKSPTLTAIVCTAATSSDGHHCFERRGVFCSGPLITRLIFVGNLPAGIAEEALKECFPDAVRAIVPSKEKEDTSEKSGG